MARQLGGKHPVTFDIFGQSFTVRSDDEPDVQRTAAAADQKMHAISQRIRAGEKMLCLSP